MNSKINNIVKTIKYFSFFSYAPSFEELYLFYPRKITKKELKKLCDYGVENNIIEKNKHGKKIYYAMRGEGIYVQAKRNKKSDTITKIMNISSYLKLLYLFPCINFLGISGSCAMMNAKEDADIDIFLISDSRRLWTARFIALTCAQLMGIRRKRGEIPAKNKVCINLLFDEDDMVVPDGKKNIYIAHEIVQMLPVIMGDGAFGISRYERHKVFNGKIRVSTKSNRKAQNCYFSFLNSNAWIKKYFPNIILPQYSKNALENKTIIGDILEGAVKKIQLYLIEKHKTTEIITDTQLWFFPNDFEKILDREKII